MSHNASTKVAQRQTLTVANRWGYAWTDADIEFVRTTRDIPAIEVAEAMGRTLYAINSQRELLDRGARRPSTAPERAPRRVKAGQRWIATADLV